MPECPRCGVSYFNSEVHSCRVEPHGVALDLPARWSARGSLAVFGLLFGLVWAVVPWATFGRLQSLESVPLASILGAVRGNPLYAGFGAVLGLLIVWPLLIVLVPAAIWTTWQLRALVETRK